MYLPTDDEPQRAAVTAAFRGYSDLVTGTLAPRYPGTAVHWAKLEAPPPGPARDAARARLAARFPVADFNAARARLDPRGTLSNGWVDALFGPVGGGGPAAA
jgi:hypothetical protein